jgi:hypothetical protein
MYTPSLARSVVPKISTTKAIHAPGKSEGRAFLSITRILRNEALSGGLQAAECPILGWARSVVQLQYGSVGGVRYGDGERLSIRNIVM